MIEDTLQSLSLWLDTHQDWILVCVAIIAFVESLAIAGIIVPGVAFLMMAGMAAGNANIDLLPLLLAGGIGASLGDGLSFWLGYHYQEHIRRSAIVQRYDHFFKKGEAYFAKHGAVSVLVGRFVGPLRPVIPMIAGMMGMPSKQYISINLLSAIAWAPFYLLPGYYLGKHAKTLDIPPAYGIAGVVIIALAALLYYRLKPSRR